MRERKCREEVFEIGLNFFFGCVFGKHEGGGWEDFPGNKRLFGFW